MCLFIFLLCLFLFWFAVVSRAFFHFSSGLFPKVVTAVHIIAEHLADDEKNSQSDTEVVLLLPRMQFGRFVRLFFSFILCSSTWSFSHLVFFVLSLFGTSASLARVVWRSKKHVNQLQLLSKWVMNRWRTALSIQLQWVAQVIEFQTIFSSLSIRVSYPLFPFSAISLLFSMSWFASRFLLFIALSFHRVSLCSFSCKCLQGDWYHSRADDGKPWSCHW